MSKINKKVETAKKVFQMKAGQNTQQVGPNILKNMKMGPTVQKVENPCYKALFLDFSLTLLKLLNVFRSICSWHS